MAYNACNSVQLIGRMTGDWEENENQDGSVKLRGTIAVKDNYRGSDGKTGSQFVKVEAFISKASVDKNGVGIYADVHQGDQVCIEASLRNNDWTDKEGKKHYDMVVRVDSITLLESKAVTEARLASREMADDIEEEDESIEG